MLIYRLADGTTLQGDADELAQALHLLGHHAHEHLYACEPEEPDELAERRADHQGERRVVPLRRPDTPVARILVQDVALDVPIPADGMTAQTLGSIALQHTGWHSDTGATVVAEAEGDAIVPMQTFVRAGAVYRLRGAR